MFLASFLSTTAFAQAGPQLVQLNPAQIWQPIEFRVDNSIT